MSAQVQNESGLKPFFMSSITYDYPMILDEAYAAAKAEAIRIYNLRGIQTVVELLRPIHLNLGSNAATTGSTTAAPWALPGTAAFTKTLKSNVAFFPWRVLNNDPT